MCRNRLCFARPLKHEELGQYSNRFKEDGKRPEDLGWSERVVEDEGEDETWTEEIFDAEGVD